ncbi:MAG: hypothetical protein ACYDDV_00905 [Methanoregula sp.]
MPKNTITDILLAAVLITAIAISIIGWSMEKREAAGKEDDLLAIPPKTPKKS